MALTITTEPLYKEKYFYPDPAPALDGYVAAKLRNHLDGSVATSLHYCHSAVSNLRIWDAIGNSSDILPGVVFAEPRLCAALCLLSRCCVTRKIVHIATSIRLYNAGDQLGIIR